MTVVQYSKLSGSARIFYTNRFAFLEFLHHAINGTARRFVIGFCNNFSDIFPNNCSTRNLTYIGYNILFCLEVYEYPVHVRKIREK